MDLNGEESSKYSFENVFQGSYSRGQVLNLEFVDHDGGELVRGEIHTNNIEGFWGILKRKLGCIGGMRRERLYLFVGEIAWKYNHRFMTITEREQALLKLVLKE